MDKKGLAGKFKILGQIGLGLIVGLTMFFSKDIVISEKTSRQAYVPSSEILMWKGIRTVQRCIRTFPQNPPRLPSPS